VKTPVSTNVHATPNSVLNEDGKDAQYGKVNPFRLKNRLGRLRLIAFLFSIYVFLIAFMWIALALDNPLLDYYEAFDSAPLWLNSRSFEVFLGRFIYVVALIVFAVLAIQRFHDLNVTGLFVLALLIPYLNLIPLFFLFFIQGSQGPNRFGKPPPPNSSGVVWMAGIAIFICVAFLIFLSVLLFALTAGAL